jgi:xylulokinase
MSGTALGIDLGLTGIRAALVDADGSIIARSRSAEAPGDDPRGWYQQLRSCVADLHEQAPDLRPEIISVAGAGPRPVLVDDRLQPLLPAPLAAEELVDHASATLVRWRDHEPAAFANAAMVLDTTGLLVGWITGAPTIDRITAADYMLSDQEPIAPIPCPQEPHAIAGTVTAQAGADLGLAAGTPVTVGTYDSYVDIDAVEDAGSGCVLLGTTMVLTTETTLEPGESGDLRVVDIVGGRRLSGWTSAAGGSIDWSRDRFGEGELEALPPGAGGLLALPYLAGERTPVWDSRARGAVIGITEATSTAQLARAMLDGVALSARDIVERMRAAGHDPDRWSAGGGGVHHTAWLQATCDALDRPIDAVDVTGGVAAAVFGLRSLGHTPALPVLRSVEPNVSNAGRFDRLYELYQRLYSALMPTMHELGKLEEDHQ